MKLAKLRLATSRLLRCRKTERYFTGTGWTDDPARAKVFADVIEAIIACVEHRLEEIELVLRIPGGSADLFSTPIR
jgi:hypothetical protein